VQMLAATFMVKPVKLTIGSASRETTSGAVELQANSRITQRVEVVDPYGKEGRVLQIIRQRQQQGSTSDRILVFCLYKKEATRIEAFLAGKGVKVGGIHGDLRQEQRTRSLEAFKSGQTPVLVATDVAARGLDIPEVKLVLNVTVRTFRWETAALYTCTRRLVVLLLRRVHHLHRDYGVTGVSCLTRSTVPPHHRGLRPPYRPYGPRRQDGRGHHALYCAGQDTFWLVSTFSCCHVL
jgi:hypothetical protein